MPIQTFRKWNKFLHHLAPRLGMRQHLLGGGRRGLMGFAAAALRWSWDVHHG